MSTWSMEGGRKGGREGRGVQNRTVQNKNDQAIIERFLPFLPIAFCCRRWRSLPSTAWNSHPSQPLPPSLLPSHTLSAGQGDLSHHVLLNQFSPFSSPFCCILSLLSSSFFRFISPSFARSSFKYQPFFAPSPLFLLPLLPPCTSPPLIRCLYSSSFPPFFPPVNNLPTA